MPQAGEDENLLAHVAEHPLGLPDTTALEAAAVQVKIPTDPVVESLNVSAAAAITLFQRVSRNV